jgi:hypothetical protein
LVLKIADFALQGALLYQVLETGLSVRLIAFFPAIIIFNAIICAAIIGFARERAGIYSIVADAWLVCCIVWSISLSPSLSIVLTRGSFDFLIVQIYPATVLVYCLDNFTFDRRELAINEQVFTPGAFESIASVLADPVERAVILQTISSLRVYSFLNLFARVGTNLVMCARLHRGLSLVQLKKTKLPAPYPGSRLLGIVFVVIAATALVVTEESVRASRETCHPHPECSVYAWRWLTLNGEDDQWQCPCLTIVDVDPRLRTYDEWVAPKNSTEKLAQLAASGDLHAIQITNRAVYSLPEQLRRCSNLRHLCVDCSVMPV